MDNGNDPPCLRSKLALKMLILFWDRLHASQAPIATHGYKNTAVICSKSNSARDASGWLRAASSYSGRTAVVGYLQ